MKQIMLNIPMAQAVINTGQIVTRCVMKEQPVGKLNATWTATDSGTGKTIVDAWEWITGDTSIVDSPPYKRGNIIYAREPWAELRNPDGSHNRYVYQATDKYPFGKNSLAKFKWKPASHMPREAARIWLSAANVKPEYLWDTYGEDTPLDVLTEYARLWDSGLKGQARAMYGWDRNPWVWKITFERCEKPEVNNGRN